MQPSVRRGDKVFTFAMVCGCQYAILRYLQNRKPSPRWATLNTRGKPTQNEAPGTRWSSRKGHGLCEHLLGGDFDLVRLFLGLLFDEPDHLVNLPFDLSDSAKGQRLGKSLHASAMLMNRGSPPARSCWAGQQNRLLSFKRWTSRPPSWAAHRNQQCGSLTR